MSRLGLVLGIARQGLRLAWHRWHLNRLIRKSGRIADRLQRRSESMADVAVKLTDLRVDGEAMLARALEAKEAKPQ